MEYNIRVFMGKEEIRDADLKNYCIKNKAVDRIVNSIAAPNYFNSQSNTKRDDQIGLA